MKPCEDTRPRSRDYFKRYLCFSMLNSNVPNITRLGSTVGGAVRGIISGNNKVHRYQANLSSSTKIFGNTDSSVRAIVFNVGREGKEGVGLESNYNLDHSIDLSMNVQDLISVEMSGYAKQYNAMASTWERSDFSGVVVRLAAGIAHYRVHHQLTMDQLSAGEERRFIGLGSLTAPVAVSDSHVFIPSASSTTLTPHTMAAFVAATTGAGGTVASDLVGVRVGQAAAMVPEAEGHDLAMGCYDALMILGANYAANGCGAQFSYCVTVGFHKVITVNSHTDEGGFFRDVLKKAAFCPPRGGVAIALPKYTGLPKPVSGPNGFSHLVDSVALETAGIVALADPMTEIDGRLYPTTVSSFADNGGVGKQANANDALANIKTIAANSTAFSIKYSELVGDVFSSKGNEFSVSKHIDATIMSMIGTHNRHLEYKVMCPWFWIEPTGSVSIERGCSTTQAEGLGYLARVGKPMAQPAFRDAEKIGENGFVSGWRVDWICARRHGLLNHLMLHKLDGLANIIPRGLDVEATLLTGPGTVTRRNESLANKVINGRGMDEYLWGRGHSSVIAPGEFINTGKSVTVMIKHFNPDPVSLTQEPLHVPSVDEVLGEVEFSVTCLMPIGQVSKGSTDKGIDRERRMASKALHYARIKGGTMFVPSLFIPITLKDPVTGVSLVDTEPMLEDPGEVQDDDEQEDLDDDPVSGSEDGATLNIDTSPSIVLPPGAQNFGGSETLSPTVRHASTIGPRGDVGATSSKGATVSIKGRGQTSKTSPAGK